VAPAEPTAVDACLPAIVRACPFLCAHGGGEKGIKGTVFITIYIPQTAPKAAFWGSRPGHFVLVLWSTFDQLGQAVNG
jgi:hypothetical protein